MKRAVALIIWSALFPMATYAAELYFVQPYDAVRVGDTIAIDVVLDPEGESANALGGGITHSQNLTFIEARTFGSVVPLWVERPSPENKMSFAGVIPGGYMGSVGASWSGYRAGSVLTLVFFAEREGEARLSFTRDTAVYANDGTGSALPTSALGLTFAVAPSIGIHKAPSIISDVVPPEPFTPYVIEGKHLGSERLFLSFRAEDKQSGVVRYEIAHSRYLKKTSEYGGLSWKDAEEPYQLSSDALRSYTYVRAIDAYGNSRVALLPPVEIDAVRVIEWIILTGVALLVLIGLGIWLNARNALPR